MSSMSGPSVSMEPLPQGDGPLGPPSGSVHPIPAGNTEQAFFRLDLRRSVQLHRRLVLAFALAGLLLGLAYYKRMWRVYLAEAVVYVQPAPPTVLDKGSGPRWPFDSNSYESYIQQQMTNVSRTDVLALALHKLGHGEWWRTNETEQAGVEQLLRTIEVTREGTSYQFSVGARASNPDVAAKLANTVAAAYIESATGEQKAGDAQRLTVLGEERDRVQKELTADRTEQEALNKQLGQASIGIAAPDHYDEDITRIRTELVKARSDHDEAAARYTSVGAGRGPSSASLNAEADELIANDAGLVSIKTALNARRAVLISQMANLTPSHPQYKQDAEELAKINASLESMASDLRAKAAGRIQLKLRTDLERTAAVEGQLNAQLGQMTGAAGGATSKLQRASDLVADIARLHTRFATVDEQWRNLTIEEGAPGSAVLITPAVAPLHLAKSGALRNALALVFAGLMFGILAAVVSHKLDPKVYIAADVEQVLGFAPLAQLPDFYEVSDGVAEEYLLRLSTAIEYARKQGNLKSCIFTGAGAGTGVTTVVTRVREMLEAMGRATVLVDASGTPPPAPRPNASGNGEQGQTGQGLITTQRGSRSSALVRQMAEESETQEGSLVLTDTAPLVVSAETEYLARFVDCAIIVAESGVTTRTQIRDVAATLQRLEVAAVGFVLNRVGLQNADPAFRLSVRAIEGHLNAQSRSHARGTVRSQPFEVEDSVPEEQIPEKTAEDVPTQPQAPKLAVAAPLPAAEVPVRLSPLTIQEQLFVPTEPSPVPPKTSKTPPAPEPVEPLPTPASDEPWWLADLLVEPLPFQTKALAEPVKVAEPQNAAFLEWAEVRAPEAAKSPGMPQVREPQPEAAAAQPLPVEPKPQSEPLPVQADVSLPRIWERMTPIESPIKSEVAQEIAQRVEPDETSSQISSRFDGLRNLVTVLGLKQMHKTAAPREPAPKFALKTDRGIERTLLVRTFEPAPEPVSASMASASPRLVTALPEFLPPKPDVDPADADNSGENGSSTRRDRWTGQDEVGILPSRRGQYKRK